MTFTPMLAAELGSPIAGRLSKVAATHSLAAAGTSDGGAFPWVLVAAIVTATGTAWLAIWTARRRSREDERARQRTLFAEAYQVCSAFKEMPYAIRRRRGDDLPGERIRLSEMIREVQGKLSYYEAWIGAESATVGEVYARLVAELRMVAGSAMSEAWKAPPITTDAEMNIPSTLIDLAPLGPLEEEFTQAVRAHLGRLAPWWPNVLGQARRR